MTRVNSLIDAQTRLRALRHIVRDEYQIDIYGIVGSFARGDFDDDSDIDVVYHVKGRPNLFDLGGVLSKIQENTGRKIDLVDVEIMPENRQKYILRDFISL